MLFCHDFCPSSADVLFGFERTELEVNEAAGDFEICVLVFNPGPDDALEATINFAIVSRPGTAGKLEICGSKAIKISATTSLPFCYRFQRLSDRWWRYWYIGQLHTSSLLLCASDGRCSV